MSADLLTRSVAAFSALTLASLLTTSFAIAATGGGFKPALTPAGVSSPNTTHVAPLQIKAAHVAKARAGVALYAGRHY